MNIKKLFFLLSAVLFTSSVAYAQKGIIRGTVIEGATGDPLIGVTVVVKGTTTGGVTDFDGKFEINIDPGTYDIQASFISFQPVTITGVDVKAGDVTVIDQITLQESVEQLQEVVVTAEAVRTTEAALLTVKRKSANLMDGISAAAFRKIGDADAAGAVKRVTGVTVEGGKYVYVRGLGDRYTKTMLNGVDIPGLDPDRNSLQIDIFPTNLIDNITVLKTALAELPADFTGGVVNIETKDFPEERILDVSFGVAFNPNFHFNDNFLTYEGSETDWLGFDSGLRELPSGARGDIPLPLNATDEEVFEFSNSFNPTLGANQQTSLMDYSLSATYGDQFDVGDNKLGFIVSGTYKSTRSFYDDLIFGEYQIPQAQDETEMVTATVQSGSQGVQNILAGGLAGLAFKTDKSKYKLTALHLQNGESTAGQFFIVDDPDNRAVGKSGFLANSDNLEYFERSLTNLFLSGEHHFNDYKWEIDWRISPTLSRIEDPDIRKAAFSVEQGQPELNAGQAGLPTRIWRYLDEVNVVSKIDITNKFEAFGNDAKVKFGSAYVFKERDYEILQYQLAFFGGQPEWTGNPNDILNDNNLYPNEGNAYFQSGNELPNPNEYNSTVNNLAGYVSLEVSPTSSLKTILGLRVEDYVQRHTGRDVLFASLGGNAGNDLDNEVVLDEFNFFPSANVIYSLNDAQNIRASYSRTVARPSFKEMSFAQILDPVSNRTFNGGLFSFVDPEDPTTFNNWDGNLRQTDINNFDLRWEMFMQKNQLLSASVFYKTFSNPIELVRIRQAQTTNEFQPRNVGNGEIYGVEFEVRKRLGFVSPGLENIMFNANVTLVESILDMNQTELEARQDFEKPGQNVGTTRQMAGQAPYVINAGFSYDNFETGLEAGIFYNVQGETLVVVGGGLFPDVFTEPFHALNFNLNKTFGAEDQVRVNFSVSNILNDVREEFFQSFQSQDQYFNRRSPGTTFGFSLGYSF